MPRRDDAGPVIAVLGLGEAGSLIAADLAAAGAVVRGYDPAVPALPPIIDTGGDAEAAAGASLILSVNSAHDAADALAAGLPGVADGATWADLNTAAPELKRELAATAARHGTSFADVAMMAPVPGRGIATPMLASGGGAAMVASVLGPLGASVEVMDGEPGTAAGRKLLRSVFFKGLAASVVEALDAARAAGCEEWLREHIGEELAAADELTVDRLVSGTRRHAVRRAAEMTAATQMLADLTVEPLVTAASRDLLERLARAGA